MKKIKNSSATLDELIYQEFRKAEEAERKRKRCVKEMTISEYITMSRKVVELKVCQIQTQTFSKKNGGEFVKWTADYGIEGFPPSNLDTDTIDVLEDEGYESGDWFTLEGALIRVYQNENKEISLKLHLDVKNIDDIFLDEEDAQAILHPVEKPKRGRRKKEEE